MNSLPWILACAFFLYALTQWKQRPMSWRCGLCGTENGDHGDKCPWRRR